VLCFAESDANQAGIFFREQLQFLSSVGYRLLYIEPSDEKKLEVKARGVLQLLEASGRQGAEVVFIFGHGERYSIELNNRSNGEQFSIDTSDVGDLQSFGKLLAPSGSVFLLSCSTGRDGAEADNVLRFLRRYVFPQAAPARIVGPKFPVDLRGIRLTVDESEDLRVVFPSEQSGG
jgi:hypothetical protein